MIRQETIERVISYVEKLPEIDPEIVRKTLTIFHLHREIEMLAETYISKRYGLSMRQMETLEALFHRQDNALTPARLAEEVHLTRSAMTSNLDSLQKKGYLTRTTHTVDRRKLIINLTEKGRALCEELMPTRYRELSMVMKSLSPEMRDTLQKTYNILIENINKMIMEASN